MRTGGTTRRCCHGHSNVVEAHAVTSNLARQTGLRGYLYTTQKAYARRLKKVLKNDELEADINMHVDTVCVSWSVGDAKLDKLRKVTAEDITLSMALEYLTF